MTNEVSILILGEMQGVVAKVVFLSEGQALP